MNVARRIGIIIVFGVFATACEVAKKAVVATPSQDELELKKYKETEEADLRLGQYVLNMIYKTPAGSKLSDGKKQVLARAIVRVSNDVFVSEDQKKAFIAVIAIESGFQRFVQSPTGPRGYAQVARATFHEALKQCGVVGLNDDDVWETDLNLYAGACYFRMQLEAGGGDPYIAIVAYNQGPNSDSVKTYTKSGRLENNEVLKYIAKFTFLQRSVTDNVSPNGPSIESLPKVGKPIIK